MQYQGLDTYTFRSGLTLTLKELSEIVDEVVEYNTRTYDEVDIFSTINDRIQEFDDLVSELNDAISLNEELQAKIDYLEGE